MGIRKYKPTTPGRRGSSVADFVELTRSTPEKSLLVPSPKTGGRTREWKKAVVQLHPDDSIELFEGTGE